jgi:hypothetical protein
VLVPKKSKPRLATLLTFQRCRALVFLAVTVPIPYNGPGKTISGSSAPSTAHKADAGASYISWAAGRIAAQVAKAWQKPDKAPPIERTTPQMGPIARIGEICDQPVGRREPSASKDPAITAKALKVGAGNSCLRICCWRPHHVRADKAEHR